jgi:hypothetical protein
VGLNEYMGSVMSELVSIVGREKRMFFRGGFLKVFRN